MSLGSIIVVGKGDRKHNGKNKSMTESKRNSTT